MGEVVPAHTSPTLHPSHCASIVVTSTVRVKSSHGVYTILGEEDTNIHGLWNKLLDAFIYS